MAEIHCFELVLSTYGRNTFLPARSCGELHRIMPNNSGPYWVTTQNGSIEQVCCDDLTASCGNTINSLTRIVTIK